MKIIFKHGGFRMFEINMMVTVKTSEKDILPFVTRLYVVCNIFM